MNPHSSTLPLVLAALGCLSGCPQTGGPSGPSDGTGPQLGSARNIDEIEAHARPSGQAAEHYGVDHPHQLSPVEADVFARVDARFRGDLTHDPALSAMIRDLSVNIPSRFDMPPTLLDALMAWYGIPDPQPAVIVVEVAGTEHGCDRNPAPECEEALDALAKEVLVTMGEKKDTRWRVGVGIMPVEGGARTRMMVGVVERTVELEPIPVAVAANGEIQLRGRLLGDRTAPRIERVDPRGKWARLPAVVGTDGSLQATVRCEGGRGVQQVEILADGRTGPEVVANFRIFCGVDRPREIEFIYERIGAKVTVADVVRGNFDLLNAEREARGLSALAWDEMAAKVATAHSRDMIDSNFVGHVSPITGDVSDRFTRAGIEGSVVRENVARGYGPKGIHEGLMNSPGHRVNILAEDITHVGIGVAFGEPESTAANAPRPVFLTQNFYAKRGSDTPDDPAKALREKIDRLREDLSLAKLTWHPGLTKLAQQRTDSITGRGPAMDDEAYRERLGVLGLKSVEQHQVEAGSFLALTELELWRELDAGARLGIGVSRVSDQRGGGVVLIILIGQ